MASPLCQTFVRKVDIAPIDRINALGPAGRPSLVAEASATAGKPRATVDWGLTVCDSAMISLQRPRHEAWWTKRIKPIRVTCRRPVTLWGGDNYDQTVVVRVLLSNSSASIYV